MTATKSFQVGTTYKTRSACDHNCIFAYPIVRRTAKTITFTKYGREQTRGIKLFEGVETCWPDGKYSMAPIISADKAEA